MRRLTFKRLLQAASLLLAAITALFAVLWAVRGIRPAIDCGLMAALARGDWPAAYACIDLAEYDALIAIVALAGSVLTWIASRKASDKPIGEYNPTPAEHTRNRDVMLDRVHAIWIDGLLDQTLYQAVLVSLDMTWRAGPSHGRAACACAGLASRNALFLSVFPTSDSLTKQGISCSSSVNQVPARPR